MLEEETMKKFILWSMYLFLSPFLLAVVTLGLGGFLAEVIHFEVTDGKQPLITLLVALLGELAWLVLLYLVCSVAT